MGLITYDTSYDDRVYLIHKSSEKPLLERMIETVLESEDLGAAMKVNAKDAVLCRMLREKGFQKKHRCGSVLSLDLSNSLEYDLPDAYAMSPRGFAADPWQYQLVIHRGFENDGIPEKWEDAFLKRIPHGNEDLKTFAIARNEYCAHCGLWYTTGDTAYVEPVATVPEHRKQGLAKAVVYEACTRAKALGAKRAIVLSDQEFYFRIGFALSSEVYAWGKKDSANPDWSDGYEGALPEQSRKPGCKMRPGFSCFMNPARSVKRQRGIIWFPAFPPGESAAGCAPRRSWAECRRFSSGSSW